jgi:hypothetical protein
MRPPNELSPLERYSDYSSDPPLAATAAGSSHTTTTASMTLASSIGHASYHSGPSEDEWCEAWDDVNTDRYDKISHSLPTYLASPPYGDPKLGYKVNQSVSPVDSLHNAHVEDCHGASTLPPTPPTVSPFDLSFSPTEQLQHSFEDGASSPYSHVVREQGLTAMPAAEMYKDRQFDATSLMHDAARPSPWERQILQMSRSYNPDTPTMHMNNDNTESIESFNKTLLPNEEMSTPLRLIDYKTTHSPDAPTLEESRTKPQGSVIELVVESILAPLACIHCNIKFNGEYQKGNLKRHIKRFHGATVLYKCRTCSASYYRDDARRKHEWKKHKAEDCRPEKRRVEKRKEVNEATEKRI